MHVSSLTLRVPLQRCGDRTGRCPQRLCLRALRTNDDTISDPDLVKAAKIYADGMLCEGAAAAKVVSRSQGSRPKLSCTCVELTYTHRRFPYARCVHMCRAVSFRSVAFANLLRCLCNNLQQLACTRAGSGLLMHCGVACLVTHRRCSCMDTGAVQCTPDLKY
jgi:hypothetical protein